MYYRFESVPILKYWLSEELFYVYVSTCCSYRMFLKYHQQWQRTGWGECRAVSFFTCEGIASKQWSLILGLYSAITAALPLAMLFYSYICVRWSINFCLVCVRIRALSSPLKRGAWRVEASRCQYQPPPIKNTFHIRRIDWWMLRTDALWVGFTQVQTSAFLTIVG